MDRQQRNTITNKVKELEKQLLELKAAQPIAGDSWIPYIYKGTVSIPVSSARFLVFQQDDPAIKGVVRISETSDATLSSIGLPPVNGKWVWVMQNQSPIFSYDREFTLYTTMKGTITVEDDPPF